MKTSIPLPLLIFMASAAMLCAQQPAHKPDTSAAVPKDTSSIWNDTADEDPSCDLQALAGNIVYPNEARRRNVQGQVVVMAYVTENGIVAETEIIFSDNPVLDEAAASAVKKTRFTPARLNGRAVKCKVTVPINFRLNN